MEQIKLDIVPAGITPTAHASQFDSGRSQRFNLYNQGAEYTLSGAETITMVVNGVEEPVANTSDNYVVWNIADGDCDEAGVIGCELRIVENDMLIGSKNFFLEVEMDPYDGTNIHIVELSGSLLTFETTLPEPLVACKADIVASQPSGTPTPSSPLAISGYTGVNINFVDFNQLASTTGITSPQTFTDVTFTKGDNGSWSASGTASGRIQTTNLFDRFYTITGHKYAVIINKDITPFVFRENNGSLGQTTQSKIFACPDGKNAYITLDSRIDITGTVVNLQNVIINIFDLTQMFGSTIADYIYTLETQTAGAGVSKFKEIFYKDYYAYNAGGTKVSVASVNNDDYPYASVSWQDEAGTVYGGVLDVTRGKLHVTHGYKNIPNTNFTYNSGINAINIWAYWNYLSDAKLPANNNTPINAISDVLEVKSASLINGGSDGFGANTSGDIYIRISGLSSVDDYKNALANGINIAYELATPQTYQLTPTQVRALVGVNNVWADTGDITIKYLAEA